MHKFIPVAALTGLLVMASGCPGSGGAGQEEPVRIDAERFRVETYPDDFALGGEQPLVTVIMFSDYACGPCGRSWKVARHLSEHFGDDVRFVFRSYTVPGFEHGDRAAEAAFAAGAQGKFWEMHWKLFDNKDGFSRPSLRAAAEDLGLDVPQFFDDLDTGAHTSKRVRHRRQATTLGIRALPVAFVNGLFVIGYKDEQGWRSLIDAELAAARRMEQEGIPRDKIYASILETAVVKPVSESDEARKLRDEAAKNTPPSADPAQLTAPDANARYDIPIKGAASIGPRDAPVVVVEFVDFACPFCRRAATEVVAPLREKYPDDVRVVFRHLPLEMHPTAPGAAKAAMAAQRQGKFAEFHDALFAPDRRLSRSGFVAVAEKLEMDVAQFEKDFDDPILNKVLEQDIALSRSLGITGTPGFFINGRFVDGLRSLATYTDLIDEELQSAADLEASGVPRAGQYDALMKDALPSSQFPNAAPAASGN